MVRKLRWLILLALLFPSLSFAQTATVNWTTTQQTIQGFGSSNLFVGNAMNPYDSLIFGTLGYSLLRSAVPIDNGVCDGSPSNSCAVDQDSITDMQSCIAHGCAEWVVVSQPPGEYNSSGTFACTGPPPVLLVSAYAAYSTYISNYMASLQTFQSVPVYAISVQNEPDLACSMPPANIDQFIKTNLWPTMNSAGQSGIKIMMPETSVYGNLTSFANVCMGDAACSSKVGIVAFHGYDNPGTPTDPYGNPPLFWQTEVSNGPSGVGPTPPGCTAGTWCPTINDALFWSNVVDTFLTDGGNAWNYFWFVDPDNGADPGGTPNANWAFINPVQSTPVSKRLYAIANWAKFVRPGMVKINATHAPASGVTVTAFRNISTGAFAIVAVNQNGSTSPLTVSFSGFTASSVTPWLTDASNNLASQTPISSPGSGFSTTLAASSVTTFVGTAGTPPPPQAATPTFSPVAGTYATTQNVSIASTSPGAIKCYTTNGATPSTNGTTGCSVGTLYTGTITVSSSITIEAVAGGTGYSDSSVATAAYIIGTPGGVYLSQAGGGSGTSCGSAQATSYFNTSGNWSSTPTGIQIGPGSTVHFCGTFTGAPSSVLLTAQGNGAAGNPVTLKFETGANFTSPAWGTAILLDGHDHFIIDGGSTCGWVNGALVNCNGTIQNTLNGTPGGTCPGGPCTQRVTGTLGISASPSNDIEVKNLAIINMYIISGGEDAGGSPGPGCIHFYATPAYSGFSVHNNVFTWSGWCLNGGQQNVSIYNNDFQFIDHGLGMGQFTDGTSNFNGVSFHDNHYHDAFVWDSPSNDFHHDGIHLFSYSASQHTNLNATITGVNVYNNRFDGDFGNNNTAWIFFEAEIIGANIFNNVGIVAPGRLIDNGLYNGYGKNVNTFNNTVIGPPCTVSMGICTTTQTQKYSIFNGPNQVVRNNVYTDGGMISVNQPYPFDCPGSTPCQTVGYTLSNNAYIAPGDFANGFGSLINGFYNYNLSGFNSFTTDTAETGGIFTDNGVPTSTYFNSSTGAELSGSPTINAGTNLTTLCASFAIPGNPCDFDIAGLARPSSGVWDVGAYQFSGSPPPPMVATPVCPGSGTYVIPPAFNATCTTSTAGAMLCYTTNGTNPTTSGGSCSGANPATITYSGPISIPSTRTITIVGTKSGDTNSNMASFAYVITAQQVIIPAPTGLTGVPF